MCAVNEGRRVNDAPSPQASSTDQPPLPEGLLCPGCGYDLRGLTSDRCPECALALTALRAGEVNIPWVHRQRLGRFRAFWKTVWWVTRWPRRLPVEMARPIHYRDSQTFRWVTTLHAYGTVVAASTAWAVGELLYSQGTTAGLWLGLGIAQVIALVLLVGLPGLASYFFHPRRLSVEQQNRAIALSYYGWGVLAWLPLALPFFVAGLFLVRSPASYLLGGACFAVAVPLVVLTIGLWQKRVYGGFRQVIHAGTAGSLARLVLLNVLALGLLLLALLLTASLLYVALVVGSLC